MKFKVEKPKWAENVQKGVADPKGAMEANAKGAKEIWNGREDSAPEQRNNPAYQNPVEPTYGTPGEIAVAPPTQTDSTTTKPYVPIPFNQGDVSQYRPREPLIQKGTFADTSGLPAQILAERQRALTGLGREEIVNRREQFLGGIEGTRATASAELARRQSATGVTGGIAFAQQQAINQAAMGARAGAERDLAIADMERRRQALNELQGYVGGERYGQISTDLAGRQLDIQEKAYNQSSAMTNAILAAILGRQPETLGGGTPITTPGTISIPNIGNTATTMATMGYPIPTGNPNAPSPNYYSPYGENNPNRRYENV